MTSMMFFHKQQLVSSISRNEQRWAHPAELGGLFIRELRGLVFGILGVSSSFSLFPELGSRCLTR